MSVGQTCDGKLYWESSREHYETLQPNTTEKWHDIDVDDDGRRQQQQQNATTTPAINVFGICALSVRLQPNTCHFIKAKIKTLHEYYFNAYLNWNINSFCIASAYVHKYTRASIPMAGMGAARRTQNGQHQQQQLKWNMFLFCRRGSHSRLTRRNYFAIALSENYSMGNMSGSAHNNYDHFP